ncbi:MAG: hypothetical protein JW957_05055 [Candidatus Omnitrophica bacterium]|nr:hypothetical protein [Candidatus Omnitrophota bacterium]
MIDDRTLDLLEKISVDLRKLLDSSNIETKEASILASYQVVSNIKIAEGQMIWSRTSLFIALNSAGIPVLSYFRSAMHPLFTIALAFVGVLYSLLWHLTLRRAWEYHNMYVAKMREHESRLKLGNLALYTSGKASADASRGGLGGIRARTFASFTTGLFISGYIALAIWAIYKWIWQIPK